MSITDELRKWVVENVTNVVLTCYPPKHEIRGTRESLLDIADRIDAEHEKGIVDALLNDGLPMSDEVMAEHGWVRLPVDADGEYIHIGDVMAYADNTKPMEVVALVPPAVFLTEDGPRYADMCRHHAPTVEDVLREMLSKYDELRLGPSAFDPFELMAEYAAKLQLREDA